MYVSAGTIRACPQKHLHIEQVGLKDMIHSLILKAPGSIYFGLLCVCSLTGSILLGFFHIPLSFNSLLPPWTQLNSHLLSGSLFCFLSWSALRWTCFALYWFMEPPGSPYLFAHQSSVFIFYLYSLSVLPWLPSPYRHTQPGGMLCEVYQTWASLAQIFYHRELKCRAIHNDQT